MTWSYSGDPASTSKDTVRFYVQDTVSADQQVSDEEITFLLTDENEDVLRAAARTAEAISAKYARQVDKTVGGLQLSAGRRQQKYADLAKQLWTRANAVGAGIPSPYAGGISQSDKDEQEADTDRVEPAFTRHMQEFDQYPEVDPNA